MMKIVICDDIDGAFQRSGELERLKDLGGLVIYDQLVPTRQMLVKRRQSDPGLTPDLPCR